MQTVYTSISACILHVVYIYIYCMYTEAYLHVYCMYTACILHIYCMYTACILYVSACILHVYCNWFQQSFHCNTPRPSEGGVVIVRVGEKVEDEVEDEVGELGGGSVTVV